MLRLGFLPIGMYTWQIEKFVSYYRKSTQILRKFDFLCKRVAIKEDIRIITIPSLNFNFFTVP